MRMKPFLVFLTAVTLSLIAATHRFGDSGHAMGHLSIRGGNVRHAVHLEPGYRQYVVVVTCNVLPPYHGNARVSVEGQPEMDYEVYSSRPVLDLGIRRKPTFDNGVLAGLQPKDRITLWIAMRPRPPGWASTSRPTAIGNTIDFRDMKTGRSLLQIPVLYQAGEEAHDVGQN